MPLLAHELGEVLGQDGGALVVVGDDLGNGHAVLGDLTVDQEAADAGVLRQLHGGHGGVRTGVVQDDGLGALGDAALEELELRVGIVVMDEAVGGVAELLGLVGRDLLHGAEEGVLHRRHDHADHALVGGFVLGGRHERLRPHERGDRRDQR